MAHHSGEHTYNFTDLMGKEGAGIRVVSQAPSDKTGSRWHVAHVKCGHTEILHGTKIRALFKNQKAPRRCRECFPKGRRIGP
jgi:hypothetical protein